MYLFLFIYCSVPISIYLSQCTYFYLLNSVRMGNHLGVTGLFAREEHLSAVNRKIGEGKDKREIGIG